LLEKRQNYQIKLCLYWSWRTDYWLNDKLQKFKRFVTWRSRRTIQ